MVDRGPSPFSRRNGRVRVSLKVTPKASPSAVTGIATDADGRAHLAVRIGAAPDGGKANAELIRLLAKRWRLAPGALHLVGGATSRRKVVEIEGGDELLGRLAAIEL